MIVEHTVIETPVGALDLFAHEGGLCGLGFEGYRDHLQRSLAKRYPDAEMRPHPDPFGYVTALRAYFAGKVDAIDAMRVDTGGTEFQQRCWTALRGIPRGETISYAELARRVGSPTAVRAVGLANGQNPICIVVPCHRVIASDGTLCGYGGGLDRKRWLLAHEGATWEPKPRRKVSPAQGRLAL